MRRKKWTSAEEVGGLGSPRQPPEQILTPEEAASWLRLRPEQLYELTRKRCAHPLPSLRCGKQLRFRLSEIDSWLTQETATPRKP
jgi:excisionase family DNA binding protein